MADLASRRITHDYNDLRRDPLPNIHFAPSENNIYECGALIIGPDGTPYEKGFFYFHIKFPTNYPSSPPQVLIKTTGNGAVRFNPNLYACGKVCLSILGTWSGPGWTPIMNLRTVLISIQSLMDAKPFFNEPGYESYMKNPSYQKQSDEYNERVQYDTLKVAVFDMLENRNGDSRSLPEPLRKVIEAEFPHFVPFYERVINEKASKSTKYDYNSLRQRLNSLKQRYKR